MKKKIETGYFNKHLHSRIDQWHNVWNEKGNILLMLKLYSALILLLSSCATKISYIGSKGTPVTTTDVYVSEQSIHKPYEVIGRGFVKQSQFNRRYEEVMQRKSLKKAKEVGADAVLFLDFAVHHPPKTITSITRSDSILNSRLSTSQVTLGPTTTYGFTILFLKYKSVK